MSNGDFQKEIETIDQENKVNTDALTKKIDLSAVFFTDAKEFNKK